MAWIEVMILALPYLAWVIESRPSTRQTGRLQKPIPYSTAETRQMFDRGK